MKYQECDVLWLTHVAIIISINQCEHNFQLFNKIYTIQTYRYILWKKTLNTHKDILLKHKDKSQEHSIIVKSF